MTHATPADRSLDILNGVDANIWEADAATLRRTFVNEYGCELLGFSREEWLKPGFWESRVHPEDRERAAAEARSRSKAERSFTMKYRIIPKDGRVLWVRDAVRDHGNGLLRGVMIDETALHQTMHALRLSEQRLRMMFESAKDFAIFSMDLEGKVTSWNVGAENVLGWSEAEMVGRNTSLVFTPEDVKHGDDVEERERARRVGRAVNERWHLHKTGRRLWGSGLMMPLRDENGKDIGVMKIMRDATDQMRAAERSRALNQELELRVAERTSQLEAANRELESFSYSVSHDLHAPLRAIDGFTRMLLQRLDSGADDETRLYVEKILGSTQRMSRLIDDLLNLARVVRGPMHSQELDLTELALEMAEQVRMAYAGRTVAFSAMPAMKAKGDRHLLGIVLFDLLDNAWKFTAKKEKPVVEVGRLAGTQPVFYVRDNGAGFDMAQGAKLFHEFSRLHDASDYAGTGIGLATVQRIVQRHGGRIWAEGKVNEGATFYFTLGEP